MKNLSINLKETKRQYPIIIEREFKKIIYTLQEYKDISKILLITDSNVNSYYGNELMDILTKYKVNVDVDKYIFPAGESNKLLSTVSSIYDKCLQLEMDRSSLIIALGGGVTGDIAGFVAATYMRGIRFAQVPTSLLAQVDSSVGGKVGVDFQQSKNIIGAFYQPIFVFTNVNALKTLNKREFISGMAEIIKHGIIYDLGLFQFIENNIDNIQLLKHDILKELIYKNCFIKAQIVEEDEKEKGLRAILNFGHTIGHGIESASDFSLLHGECVSIGMVAAVYISLKRKLISNDEYERIISLLKKMGLPIKVEDIDDEQIYKEMQKDKKKEKGKLKFILPIRLGEVIQVTDVTIDEVYNALNHIIHK